MKKYTLKPLEFFEIDLPANGTFRLWCPVSAAGCAFGQIAIWYLVPAESSTTGHNRFSGYHFIVNNSKTEMDLIHNGGPFKTKSEAEQAAQNYNQHRLQPFLTETE